MTPIEKAIKHFECVRDEAKAVLDSGFGTKPNESNILFKNRKLYAELAIKALEKQIPKKPVGRDLFELGTATGHTCPTCGYDFPIGNYKPYKHCPECGQRIKRGDSE